MRFMLVFLNTVNKVIINMEWKVAEPIEGEGVKIPERWLHLYYYEALNTLFRFENALRLFVYVILKKNLGKNWDTASLGSGITIRTETKQRITQSRDHGYLGDEVTSPMLYLNSGELTQLIISDTYWKYFAQFFKASKSIVTTKLQEIGTIRNSLAHFRPIKQDDIALIKQNSKHLFLEVERCLVHITSISGLVPTNSEEKWYVDIKSIGNVYLSINLFFSNDQEWVRLELSYKIPTLKKSPWGDSYVSYKAGNLRTSQLLKKFHAIRESCIYISEAPIYGSVKEDLSLGTLKKISIVFSRETLASNLETIVADLKSISLKVESETTLITQDHLARGELVESLSLTAIKRENRGWECNMSAFMTSLADIEEVEFWGERSHFEVDFISSTSHYPWMPSSVSKYESPF